MLRNIINVLIIIFPFKSNKIYNIKNIIECKN